MSKRCNIQASNSNQLLVRLLPLPVHMKTYVYNTGHGIFYQHSPPVPIVFHAACSFAPYTAGHVHRIRTSRLKVSDCSYSLSAHTTEFELNSCSTVAG